MNMEHVEVLRNLSEVCRASIKAGDWKVDGACDPDAVLRRADSAIAALSAPQPPAEAQPVAWEWEYIGVDQYPRGHKVARSLREMDPTNPPYPETWRPTRPLIYGDAPPPSAPVGVEGLPPDVQEIVRKDDAAWALAERAEAAGAERDSDDDGTWWTLRIEHFKALAQPSAPDSDKAMKWHAWRLTRLRDQLRSGLRPDELKAFEAALAALAQQPAAVDGDNPYPAPRNRQEAAALARLALAYLGVTSAHIDAVVARCETDLAAQPGGSDNDR